MNKRYVCDWRDLICVWLTLFCQDEGRLAQAAGMNAFTAAIITSKVSLGDFLEMAPQDRQDEFGLLVGERRIKRLNAWIAERQARIDPSSPSSDPAQSP